MTQENFLLKETLYPRPLKGSYSFQSPHPLRGVIIVPKNLFESKKNLCFKEYASNKKIEYKNKRFNFAYETPSPKGVYYIYKKFSTPLQGMGATNL